MARRWQDLGLKGARSSETNLEPEAIVQLVAEAMALDPSGRSGKANMKRQIAMRTGVHLKRYVL